MRLLVAALLVVCAVGTADARTIRGLVYADANGDGKPSIGERGIPGAVVAYGISRFVTTNARGELELEVPDSATGIVWVRVPEGFAPGPVWARVEGTDHVDLGVRPLRAPHTGPLTFVVAADTHVSPTQPFWADLTAVARDALALDPPPAFFTILGDITQGNQDREFDLVDAATRDLPVPYVPVPGNHDWYDGGATWFRRYGPDNYSFDIGGVHFVVWNMSMTEDEITRYLGEELSRVAPAMTIVALTHAPPTPAVVRALDALGVDYLLTGHTHSNRVVDHGGLVEIATEPMLMGGLDFTPAGYRVLTIDHGEVTSSHRTVVDAPLVEIVAPARGQCAPPGSDVVVAAELDASALTVSARLDCGSELALRFTGGWSWRAALPPLADGAHTLTVTAQTASGRLVTRTVGFAVCATAAAPALGPAWPQPGGNAAHHGFTPRELAPPLATRWTASVGGHVLHASPAIADGAVFVTAADLAGGQAGGVIALELATGATRWRVATPLPVRGAPVIVEQVVVVSQLDGTILAFDTRTGAPRWRHELGVGVEPRAAAIFAAPVADAGDVIVGNQRRLAAISASSGGAVWELDPVRGHEDFVSLAALAVDDGVAIGTFDRELGGVLAWERLTGRLLWHLSGYYSLAINATPVIGGGLVYLVTGATDVVALDLHTGERRWATRLDPVGFDWGIATIGTPALAHGILVVPTLWRELVALDATSGMVLWRHAATQPSPLRTNHYRGKDEAGFAASPVITGDLVWAADTAGRLTALDLHTGRALWQTSLEVPVLAGLAVSGDWLVAASFDGAVRALAPVARERRPVAPARCEARPPGGCCGAAPLDAGPLVGALAVLYARRRRRRASSASAIGAEPTAPPPPAAHA